MLGVRSYAVTDTLWVQCRKQYTLQSAVIPLSTRSPSYRFLLLLEVHDVTGWGVLPRHRAPGTAAQRYWTMVDHGRARSIVTDHGRPWTTMVEYCRPDSIMADQSRPWATRGDQGRPPQGRLRERVAGCQRVATVCQRVELHAMVTTCFKLHQNSCSWQANRPP